MAVAFRSAATGTSGSTTVTAYTVARPAGVVDGDLLILLLYQATTDPSTYMVLPPGFLAGAPAAPAGDPEDWAQWAWKVAADEPASYSMISQRTGWATCSILAFTGVEASAPFSAGFADWITTGDRSATKTTPSVTPDANDSYVLRLAVSANSSTTAESWTPPAGHTELLDYAPTTDQITHTAAGRQLSGGANTATGTADFTFSSAQLASFGTTAALRPVAGPPVSTPAGFSRVQAASNGAITTSLAVSLPKAPTPGNLLVCWWCGGSAATLTNSGWTAGPRVDANVGSAMYYKIATSADTATVTFTLSRNDVTGGFIEYAGNTAAPFDRQATSSVFGDNGAYSITAVSTPTSSPNDLIVSLAALRASVTAGYPTAPAWTGGLTNVLAQGDGQSSASNVTCYSFYGDNLDAGPAGTTSVQASWSTTQFKQRTGLAMSFTPAMPTRTVNRGGFFAFT